MSAAKIPTTEVISVHTTGKKLPLAIPVKVTASPLIVTTVTDAGSAAVPM